MAPHRSDKAQLTAKHDGLGSTVFAVQSHVAVLQLRGESLLVVRVSKNIEALLGTQPVDVLGCSLEVLLGEKAVAYIRSVQLGLSQVTFSVTPQYVPLTLDSGEPLEGWLHRSGDGDSGSDGSDSDDCDWVLELETVPAGARQASQSFSSHFQQFRSQVAQLRQVASEQELLQSAAIATQKFTQFDRVLIYRFATDGSGMVVAEAHGADSALADVSYLGLHFPATDIPADSREGYALGALRYVPDLTAEPVGFVPAFADSVMSRQPEPQDTDLPELDSYEPNSQEPVSPFYRALYRAVDDCCITYHRNIQVQAFLVIPLLQQEQLWGLMVCHHSQATELPVAVRLDCSWLGQILSAELAQKDSQNRLMERERLKAHQSQFLAAIAQSDDFVQGLIQPELRLLGLANAQGAAVFFESQVTTVGEAPPPDFLLELYDWAMTQIEDSTYQTCQLPKAYPAAKAHKDTASGLLFLSLSSARHYAIAWFRPEVLQTVTWAGNPADSYASNEAGEQQLCPRASFAQWRETVCLTSLPWHPWEIETALDLRNAIVGVVLRKADEMMQINQELERSNQELAAFAYAASHDLKEPLRGINNYARLLLKENQGSLSEKAIERLNTLTKLTRRMGRLIDALLRFSRIGQTELHWQTVDLNLLIARVIEMQELSQREERLEIWTPRILPSVQADPVLLSEVYNNLLSNALKYNTSHAPWAEIGYYSAEEMSSASYLPPSLIPPVLYVRDNGIGIPEQHWGKVFELFKRLYSQKKYGGGTGAGLTITKKIIERHGGKIGVFSDGKGTTFYWTLG